MTDKIGKFGKIGVSTIDRAIEPVIHQIQRAETKMPAVTHTTPDARLSRRQLADRVGVTPATVSNWIQRGVCNVFLRAERAGARLRICWDDYLAFQEAVDRRRGVQE